MNKSFTPYFSATGDMLALQIVEKIFVRDGGDKMLAIYVLVNLAANLLYYRQGAK